MFKPLHYRLLCFVFRYIITDNCKSIYFAQDFLPKTNTSLKKLDIKMYLKLQRIFLQLPLCPLFIFALTTWSLDLDLNTVKKFLIDSRFLLFLFNVLFVHLKMNNTDVSIIWSCHLCQQCYLILTNDKRLSLWLFIGTIYLYVYQISDQVAGSRSKWTCKIWPKNINNNNKQGNVSKARLTQVCL